MLILTLLSQLFIHITVSCPSYCTCEDDVVNCSNNLLDSIPPDIPSTTRILNVTNNRLQYLAESSFYGLNNLQELHLQSNIITVVHENTFRYNVKLKLLSLKNNNLRELSEDLFLTNNRLKQLDVRDNPHLTFIPYRLIEHLQHFTSLKASNVDCGCDMFDWYRNMQLLHDKGLHIDITCATPPAFKDASIQIIPDFVFEGCTSRFMFESCNYGEAMCNDGTCISDELWCDGNFDCFDVSDEMSCSTEDTQARCETQEDGFLCSDGSKCIPDTWLCDKHSDCSDSSDENNCSSDTGKCQPGEYQCSNGRCISNSVRCDGSNDCGDWSDESKLMCGDLDAVDPCPVGMSMCPQGGGCIDHKQQCDGIIDCDYGLDENNCFDNCTSHCSSDKRCITDSWLCDGVPDCSDASDEKNCEYTCAEDEIKCGGCLSCQFICDGLVDCYDGIDEHACTICNSSICLGSPQTIIIIVCVVSACFLVGSAVLFLFLYRRKRSCSTRSSSVGEDEIGPPQYTEIDQSYLREEMPNSPPPRYKSEPDITTTIVGGGLYPQHAQDI